MDALIGATVLAIVIGTRIAWILCKILGILSRIHRDGLHAGMDIHTRLVEVRTLQRMALDAGPPQGVDGVDATPHAASETPEQWLERLRLARSGPRAAGPRSR